MCIIRMSLLVILLVILLLVLFIIVFKRRENIPRIIWTYWDSGDLPPMIQRCIDSWYKHNPGYTINVLNRDNLHTFLSRDRVNQLLTWKYNDSQQRFSDLVRLNILSKYGGVWLDASIVCYESFDWIYEEGADCLLYSIPELAPPNVPLLESWFIACPPGNEFVTKWRDEFMEVEKFKTIDSYIKTCDFDLVGINFPDYLLVYVCARKIYLQDPSRVKILNATTGPYKYHAQGGIKNICNIERPKFYKFRKEDRLDLVSIHGLEGCCVFD